MKKEAAEKAASWFSSNIENLERFFD